MESTTVVVTGDTLTEKVQLPLGDVRTHQLYIDLVQVIRLKEEGGDNTPARGSLDVSLDATKHEVVV